MVLLGMSGDTARTRSSRFGKMPFAECARRHPARDRRRSRTSRATYRSAARDSPEAAPTGLQLAQCWRRCSPPQASCPAPTAPLGDRARKRVGRFADRDSRHAASFRAACPTGASATRARWRQLADV